MTSNLPNKFGMLVAYYRNSIPLTQEELAILVFLDPKTFYRIEQGKGGGHRKSTLDKLAEVFEEKLKEQFNRTEFFAAYDEDMAAKKGTKALLLPAQTSTFVGRKKEIKRVGELLLSSDVRLLTLMGTGGIGKTRLAIEAARTLQNRYEDGVYYLDLRATYQSNFVIEALVRTFALQDQGAASSLEVVQKYLAVKHLLLVLDNCEQIAGSVAQIAEALLKEARDLTILVTSSQSLGVNSEQVYEVPALSVPSALEIERLPLRDLLKYDAIDLFNVRLEEKRQSTPIPVAQMRIAAHICRKVDAVPLAIELTVAQLPRESEASELYANLKQIESVVAAGMEETLLRSYNTLSATAQTAFRRLAVFMGGGRLSALATVGQVATSEVTKLTYAVLDDIEQLMERSLLSLEIGSDGRRRYRMLEPVRIFALSQLSKEGSNAIHDVQQVHAEYFVDWARATRPEQFNPNPEAWLAMEADHDNLRVALDHLLKTRSVRLAGKFAHALWEFWNGRQYWTEGRRWLRLVMALSNNSTPEVADLLSGAGVLAWQQGDFKDARSLYDKALRLYKAGGKRREEALVLTRLGAIDAEETNLQGAKKHFQKSLKIYKTLPNADLTPIDQSRILHVYNNFGLVELGSGRFAEAHAILERVIARRQEIGDSPGVAAALDNIGVAELGLKKPQEARAHFTRSFEIRNSGKTPDRGLVANSLNNLGNAAYAIAKSILDSVGGTYKALPSPEAEQFQKEFDLAASYYRDSLKLYKELGNPQGVVECIECLVATAGLKLAGSASNEIARSGAMLLGFAENWRYECERPRAAIYTREYDELVSLLRASLGATAYDEAKSAGAQERTLEKAFTRAQKLLR